MDSGYQKLVLSTNGVVTIFGNDNGDRPCQKIIVGCTPTSIASDSTDAILVNVSGLHQPSDPGVPIYPGGTLEFEIPSASAPQYDYIKHVKVTSKGSSRVDFGVISRNHSVSPF